MRIIPRKKLVYLVISPILDVNFSTLAFWGEHPFLSVYKGERGKTRQPENLEDSQCWASSLGSEQDAVCQGTHESFSWVTDTEKAGCGARCVGGEHWSCCVGLVCLAGVLVTTDWWLGFFYPPGWQLGIVRPSETTVGPQDGASSLAGGEGRGRGVVATTSPPVQHPRSFFTEKHILFILFLHGGIFFVLRLNYCLINFVLCKRDLFEV